MIREKYVFKREFLYLQRFHGRFLHFAIGVKEKPEHVHLKLIFCHVLDRFNLRERNDLTCLTRTVFLGLTYGFLNKHFQETIKLFICNCSFIALAEKTTTRLQIVRFLETFRRALS